jgi:hypothetical protein
MIGSAKGISKAKLERAENNQSSKVPHEHFEIDPKQMRSSLRGSGEMEIDIDWKIIGCAGLGFHSIPRASKKKEC